MGGIVGRSEALSWISEAKGALVGDVPRVEREPDAESVDVDDYNMELTDSSGAQPWHTDGGNVEWTFSDGTLHRNDGPAFIHVDGTTQWFQQGKLHRSDGPAIVYSDGTASWWLEGKRYPNENAWAEASY